MSNRPTPPYRSLIENPNWIKKQCRRCEVDFWVEPCKVGTVHYCVSTCRYESPFAVIEKRTVKEGHLNGCWICSLAPTSPYPVIKTKGDTLRVARVVLEQSLGRTIGENMKALHKCNEPRCVRVGPEHIYEGTQQDNIKWCVESGRLDDRKGAKCPNAKLTEEQARDIKFNPSELTGRQLAAKHNISEPEVSAIRNGHHWCDLKE